MAKYQKPAMTSVHMSVMERDVLNAFLASRVANLPDCDERDILVTLYGRLRGGLAGDTNMTMEESRFYLGRDWYISPTGKRLVSQPGHMWPITPRKYSELTEAVIRYRGYTALGISCEPAPIMHKLPNSD